MFPPHALNHSFALPAAPLSLYLQEMIFKEMKLEMNVLDLKTFRKCKDAAWAAVDISTADFFSPFFFFFTSKMILGFLYVLLGQKEGLSDNAS